MPTPSFIRSEDGSGGMWSLFIFVTCAVVAGLAIDGTNSIRAKEHLQSTADIAAHAGVTELAFGGTEDSIRTEISRSIEANMPASKFGNVLGDTSLSVKIGHYTAGSLDTSGEEDGNAAAVQLQMSASNGNALRTFLLGFIGLDAFNIVASSVAVMDSSAACKPNDGIYAHGSIKFTSSSDIGPGFCIYSKELVDLSNHNVFAPGAHVGMPDLINCGHCEEEFNPGVDDAKFEANLEVVDVGAHIDSLVASLTRLSNDSTPLDEFLSDKTLSSSLDPLAVIGFNVNQIKKGSILSIKASDFQLLTDVPSGLIYAVYCGSPIPAKSAISAVKSSDKNSGAANVKTLSMETAANTTITGVAVITDCKLNFGTTAHVVNSVIATTSTSVQAVSANSYAKIGKSGLVCPSDEKVVIMAKGDMSIPAAMQTNNVDFYIQGDVQMASGTSGMTTKLGTSFYVGGDVNISAQGTWTACGDEPDSFSPTIKAIRHVIASAT